MPDDGTLFPFLLFMVGVWVFAFLGALTGYYVAHETTARDADPREGPEAL